MEIKELIQSGNLKKARVHLVEDVKKRPGHIPSRTQLFQILLFYGEWDKAKTHLKVLAAQDQGVAAGCQLYEDLITAEKRRQEVYLLDKEPDFLPKQPAHARIHWKALTALKKGDVKRADQYFEQALQERPLISGTVNGEPFSGFSDTDTTLAGCLEVMEYDRYLWIPHEEIREMTIEPPRTLFDLIWAKGAITTWKGLSLNCLLPVLYPLSHRHGDDRIKMGRMTDWEGMGGTHVRGMGQHVFQVGDKELALFELNTITFNFQGGRHD